MASDSLLLPWDSLLFALLAATSFAALDLSQKWAARYAVPTPLAFLTLRLLAGAILSPLLLLLPGALNGQAVPVLPLVGLVLFNLLGNILYVICVYRADISVLGSLWPLKNAYLPLLVFLLPPHAVFPLEAYGLVAVATLGALLISWNGRQKFQAIKERPVFLMALVTVPLFALSDYFFQQVVRTIGSPLTTVLVAWSLAALVAPVAIAHEQTRKNITKSLKSGRGVIGALLTGIFLVLGVVCIGQAFKCCGARGLVLVNVYAMLSGVILLLVNALLPGWLDREARSVYPVRFAGALLLIAAAASLKRIEAWLLQHS
jgi:hypothetical protein